MSGPDRGKLWDLRPGQSGDLPTEASSAGPQAAQDAPTQPAGDWNDSTLSLPTPQASPGSSGAAAELPIDRIPGYRIVREIGRGGMGVVYLAWDEQLGRNVAIKLLLNAVCGPEDPGFERFIEGARAAAAVRHPGLVTIHHAGLVDQVPYLVMEYIEGPSLSEILRQAGPLSQAAALSVMDAVCAAVDELHRGEIVHGDIKPANVLVDMEGRLFVTDFGLACRQRSTGAEKSEARPVGTPAYMAPEAFEGSLTIRGDVYSLGITMYELLAGSLPFAGPLATVREQHSSESLPLASLASRQVSTEVAELIERAAHKNSFFRHKSAGHLRRAIAEIAGGAEALARGTAQLRVVAVRCREGSPDLDGLTARSPTPGSYFDTLGRMASAKRSGQTPVEATPGIPPTESRPALPPERAVALDVPCAQCRYNLRGLPENRNCPECGLAVASSLDPSRLMYSDAAWLAKIHSGAGWLNRMMILSVVAILVAIVLMIWHDSEGEPLWMSLLDILVFGTFGVLLARTLGHLDTEPGQPVRPLRSLGLTFARLAAVLFLPMLVIQLVTSAAGRYERFSEISMRVATAAFWIVAVPAYLLALGELARRIPDDCLARRTRAAAGLLVALPVAGELLALLGVLRVAGLDMAGLVSVMVIIQALLFWRTVRVYRRSLRKVVAESVKRSDVLRADPSQAAQRPSD